MGTIVPWLYNCFFHCFTAYEDSFLLHKNNYEFCLYQYPYNTKYTFVQVGATCSYDNLDYLWIWTNFGQLLNWATLECMTDDYHTRQNQHFVTTEKCDRNNQKQLWECVGNKKYKIKQTQSGRRMYYGEHSQYVTTKDTYWYNELKWMRFGSKKDVCSEGTVQFSNLIINK